jgi:hypothetical protein
MCIYNIHISGCESTRPPLSNSPICYFISKVLTPTPNHQHPFLIDPFGFIEGRLEVSDAESSHISMSDAIDLSQARTWNSSLKACLQVHYGDVAIFSCYLLYIPDSPNQAVAVGNRGSGVTLRLLPYHMFHLYPAHRMFWRVKKGPAFVPCPLSHTLMSPISTRHIFALRIFGPTSYTITSLSFYPHFMSLQKYPLLTLPSIHESHCCSSIPAMQRTEYAYRRPTIKLSQTIRQYSTPLSNLVYPSNSSSGTA